MALPLDPSKSIPVGSDLRILLNSDHISYGEIHSLLKAKGIYVADSDKAVTVPLLAATILTPSEFFSLIEASVDREQKPKTKVASIPLVSSTSDWVSPIRDDLLSSAFDVGGKNESVEFSVEPTVVIDSADKLVIPYTISRKDYSKDWIERELPFDGSVSVEKNGASIKLEISSVHSSKETDEINRKIVSRISNILKSGGVSLVDEPVKITFGSFSHVERVRFFKRLAGGNCSNVDVGDVNDIEIGRDGMDVLPADPRVSWMGSRVRRLKIGGDKLHEIFLISDESYYSYYYISHMDVTYPFVIGVNRGSMRVHFSFSSSRMDENRNSYELQSEVVSIKYSGRVNADAKKAIARDLDKEVRSLVDGKYDGIIGDRVKVDEAVAV